MDWPCRSVAGAAQVRRADDRVTDAAAAPSPRAPAARVLASRVLAARPTTFEGHTAADHRERELLRQACFTAPSRYGSCCPGCRGAVRSPRNASSTRPDIPGEGLLLDSSRHFQSPGLRALLIDWMAWHKLNVLHWHLTDDQGWRLEIRKYPLAHRRWARGAGHRPRFRKATGKKPYGGYYTQQQVREIVAL